MIFESKDEFLNKLNKLENFKVLGIDFGTKKSGLAIYNSSIKIVTPLQILQNITQNFNKLLELIDENCINGIIVGKPVKLNGLDTENINQINKLVKLLSNETKLPIILVDERFTTSLANTLMKQANIKRKERNKIDDLVSASIILEEFFY
ncbi:Holliday junction resolvase RuvX [Rickettsiales endosymbiont of Trichoplax sp. H2]|uniref:Holliday junction resolvase RuvX n=1 Tax=Rickettsiales endosymbiont of Trichoplax sp. H2 TaxID=2021221 RepID=UPI0012B3B4C6|nr:Holliday junction resolvase RuvX [Rickettsiales endosymbiont of Trichoplax sp. H2]MSO13550.1 putative pre-16S rRNA nuclease [Rickettsiales endosymbiont of Trichoplax sp. H2]